MIKICLTCNKEFENAIRINNVRSRSRLVCFDCKPFKSDIIKNSTRCELCKLDFICLSVPNSTRKSICSACLSGIDKMNKKIKSIEYLGGECVDCGWREFSDGFDFHHKDISNKKYELNNLWDYSFNRIKIELDKCILLCSLCHRKRHLSNKRFLYLDYIRESGGGGKLKQISPLY